MARVDHPNVARCLGAERIDGEVLLVVEYIPGRDLTAALTDGPLRPAEAARIVEQVAEGLAAAHAVGLLHRDLKPANVLLGDDGRPRLVDFGLAAGGLGSEHLRGISGTLAYMAPEQARAEPERIDPRTDDLGLGAVLYALLTGRRRMGARPATTSSPRPASAASPPPARSTRRSPGPWSGSAGRRWPGPANRFASAAELAGRCVGFDAGRSSRRRPRRIGRRAGGRPSA